ncbi:MAG: hypothetical protein MPK11_08890 [Gammaproteobacteria bacterium]|nr:hypothetical protein [Gammaproteobacteria bacterium]MDA8002592.1 hypothetical protein [Alphaproteobacteria bacterium]CAJ2377374.1 MAG: membrane hypothetical protein [Arenicellales bacterium IbO2]MDA7962657.1 hypothetical protein [Gammaproteobacteria bacterium]MDA7970866.1 hypothetical protein [Gammaproteobacteria bacterium]
MLVLKKKLLWFFLASSVLAGAGVGAQEQHDGSEGFKEAPLPLGGTMRVPATWQALTLEEYFSRYGDLDDFSAEVKDALSKSIGASYAKFDADGDLSASVAVEFLPIAEISQEMVRSASNESIADFDAAIKEEVIRSRKEFGSKIQNWIGHRKVYIDDWAVLHNTVQYITGEIFETQEVFRVFSEEKSFMIVLTFVDQRDDLRLQIEQIIESIRLGPIAPAVADDLAPEDAGRAWLLALSDNQRNLLAILYVLLGIAFGCFPAFCIRRIARRQFGRVSSALMGVLSGIFAAFFVILADAALPYPLQLYLPVMGAVLGISYGIFRRSGHPKDAHPKNAQDL